MKIFKFLKNKNIFRFGIVIFIMGLLLQVGQVFAQDNSAQTTQNFKDFSDNIVNNVLTSAGTLLITGAFIMFFYGVVMFIYGRVTNKGDLKELEKGKQFMLWGLIALFVMVSVWGIIKMAQEVLDIKGNNNIQIQSVEFAPLSNTNMSKDPIGEGNGITPNKNLPVITSPSGPIQTDSSGTSRENPFANTTFYPILSSTSDVVNNQTNLGAFLKLNSLLIAKKCVISKSSTWNNSITNGVKSFQSINGLTIDGIVGKDTWEALSVTTGSKTTFTGIIVKDCK